VADDAIPAIFKLLEVSSLDQVRDMLSGESAALQDVERFMSLLSAYGIADMVEFDISVIRGLSYYTGIVFEAFDVHGKLRAIFGGGRYDNLLGDIGAKPATAVGLGFGDVVIAELLNELGKSPAASDWAPDMVVGFMQESQQETALKVAAAFRRDGRRVDLALNAEKPKKFFGRASKIEASKAVYIGPDDIESGTIRIKELADRSQQELALAELLG
jgi:histidyl-tRNA synthetase